MMHPKYLYLIPAVVLLCAAAGLALWMQRPAPDEIAVRGPVRYVIQRPDGVGPSKEAAVVEVGEGKPADDAWGSWPAFRGPDYDLVSREGIDLADAWPAEGPRVLWTKDVGDGYASPAALGGRLFMLDYDKQRKGDVIRCFSLADGKDIWTHFYPIPTDADHGVTRSVPAVTDKYVVTISPECFVVCVDTDTGAYRWSIDLVAEYGTLVPDWYAAQCPIIDDGKAIIAPAGTDVLMMAVDCETGKVVWQAPNKMAWDMTHSSITPMTIDGRKMYIYPASEGVVGVWADDGTIAFEHEGWIVPTANVPCPVVVGDDKVFLTGGYGAGSRMLQIVQGAGGKVTARTVYSLSNRVFSTYQQTPIFYKDFLYGVLTKTAGPIKEQLACLSPEGKVVWTSGREHRFGWGPYVIADDKIFVMDDHGHLTMATATAAGFKPLGTCQPFGHKAHEAWGPLTLIGGRMIARDLKTMVCIDLRPVEK